MEEAGVLDKISLVFGQMNEPPGNRLRVALTGLTMAEKFRDEGRDVLLFVDNIYWLYSGAGTEVSALGRMPSAVAISQRWLKKWVFCKNESPRPRLAPSRLYRRYTYQRMT